ncbi:hypothetical protein ABI59_15245 [Acidobacteria bacterium Mor1]|nr:hypothetical protein ABI59_15245 [Acidobacteria bacterium Mor1]
MTEWGLEVESWISNWFDRPVFRSGFAFGHQMYTPEDIEAAELDLADRPWAAWLYGSFLLTISSDDDETSARDEQGAEETTRGADSNVDDRAENPRPYAHQFELQLGVVGPPAGGRFIQKEIHQLIGDGLPTWVEEVDTKLGANLNYEYRTRLGNRNFGASFAGGGALGNVAANAFGRVDLQAGWNIDTFAPGSIRNAFMPTQTKDRSKRDFHIFLGVEGRLVGRNIFLDGSLERGSRHTIDTEHWVYDYRGGLSIRYKRFRVSYTYIERSKEFTPTRQFQDGTHGFGSFLFAFEPWRKRSDGDNSR